MWNQTLATVVVFSIFPLLGIGELHAHIKLQLGLRLIVTPSILETQGFL